MAEQVEIHVEGIGCRLLVIDFLEALSESNIDWKGDYHWEEKDRQFNFQGELPLASVNQFLMLYRKHKFSWRRIDHAVLRYQDIAFYLQSTDTDDPALNEQSILAAWKENKRRKAAPNQLCFEFTYTFEPRFRLILEGRFVTRQFITDLIWLGLTHASYWSNGGKNGRVSGLLPITSSGRVFGLFLSYAASRDDVTVALMRDGKRTFNLKGLMPEPIKEDPLILRLREGLAK